LLYDWISSAFSFSPNYCLTDLVQHLVVYWKAVVYLWCMLWNWFLYNDTYRSGVWIFHWPSCTLYWFLCCLGGHYCRGEEEGGDLNLAWNRCWMTGLMKGVVFLTSQRMEIITQRYVQKLVWYWPIHFGIRNEDFNCCYYYCGNQLL